MGRTLIGIHKVNCGNCGKEFIPKHYHWDSKFCSRECSGKISGFKKGCVSWNKGLSGYRKGYKMSYETKKKIGESNRKLHKNNVTPIKNLVRSQMEYKIWRDKIYKRDNYTCQCCFERTEVGNRKVLHAHHIKKFADIIREFGIKTIIDFQRCKILNDENNGITLCDKCHRKLHTGNENIILNGEKIVWQKSADQH